MIGRDPWLVFDVLNNQHRSAGVIFNGKNGLALCS
jgi:hypothetical protein